jgi:pimeloyl-ACP methyl ester carboxylesterase
MGCFAQDVPSDALRRDVSVMGRRVVFWEIGSERPGNVVMLHGFRGNRWGLAATARSLDAYRLIVPDRPGYGESEPLDKPHTLTNYAIWLDEFVQALGLDSFVSWGHSYGGSVALIHSVDGARKPTAVVGVSLADMRRGPLRWLTTCYYRFGEFLPGPARKRWLTSQSIERVAGRMLFRTIGRTERATLNRQRFLDLTTLIPRVITEEYMSAGEVDLESYARATSVPVLIVAGGRDTIVPLPRLRRLVALMPSGRLTVLPDQGHMAPIEQPAETARITDQFVRDLRLC